VRSAIGLYNATGVRVSHNRLTGGDWVLHLVDTQDAELSHNEVVAADFSAVVLIRVSATEVSGNTVAAPVWGIAVLDSATANLQIVNNAVTMQPGSADAISVSRSSEVKLVNNDIRSSSLGSTSSSRTIVRRSTTSSRAAGRRARRHRRVRAQDRQQPDSRGRIRRPVLRRRELGNQVTANRVWCASPGGCELIKDGGDPDFYRNNKVQANRLMR